LSFTTRAFTATRRERVRPPLPSRLRALRSFNASAAATPLPRASNRPPPFPVSPSRFGLPPARRTARWTSAMKLVWRPRAPPIRCAVVRSPRSRTLPGRMRKSSSSRAMRRQLEDERHSTRAEFQSARCSVRIRASTKTRRSLMLRTSRATALGALKENDKWEKRRSLVLMAYSERSKTMCRQKPRTKSGSEATRFILPSTSSAFDFSSRPSDHVRAYQSWP
jgi:hypothetical protein